LLKSKIVLYFWSKCLITKFSDNLTLTILTLSVGSNLMKNITKIEKYETFIKRLNYFKSKGLIKILHRGFSTEFGYDRFNLHPKYHNLNDFAKLLFYYGDKSKYFWNQMNGRDFGLNETNDEIFVYIFKIFNELVQNQKKIGTKRFVDKNKINFNFFKNENNKKRFIKEIGVITYNEKLKLRNYYFRIIHQLGETTFKNQSLMVSSSENENIAKKNFSNNEIVISFWDFNFNNFSINNTNLPVFKGKPYKNQKEISVFGAIFPHYIYSVKCKNKEILNPAIFDDADLDEVFFCGFNINQEKFKDKFKAETKFEFGIQSNNSKSEIIKI